MTASAVLAIAMLGGCGGGEGPALTVEKLQDPATCNECHPKHVTQWSGSMHAYASDDPVFVAMNNRGQRETSGALGTFCVKCHAPMAVQLGLTDGKNFDPAALPAAARGVTCYFCHNVKSVDDSHNNAMTLALDQTMRGGVSDPVSSPAHHSSYDKLMDSDANQSEICGSCHDVVTPRGVELERTFKEWKTTFFSQPDPQHHLTCGACHMISSSDVIADAPDLHVGLRQNGFHEHAWPGIDQALTAFAGADAQAAAIERDLDPSIAVIGAAKFASNLQGGGICLDQPGIPGLTVRMDSVAVGHSWPSGAAQDRRAWLEVVATSATGTVLFHSGTQTDGTPLPEGMDPEDLADPTLFGLWDRAFKDDGSPAHFFWDIARVDSQLLRPPVTLDKNSPAFDHSSTATFNVSGVAGGSANIDKITARVRIRPLAYSMLDDLVSSGDLDAAVASQLRTLDILGTQASWSRATAGTGPVAIPGCAPQ